MYEAVVFNKTMREKVIAQIKASYPDTRFNYEYRGKYPNVFSHQKVMYNMMALSDVCSIQSDPGTCKTGPYIWAIDKRIQKGQIKRALVITLSSLKENVLAEIQVQAPHLRAVVIDSSANADKIINHKFRQKKRNADYDIYIANYELMFKVVELIDDKYFGMVVLDEVHRVGSHNSRQTIAILDKFETVKYKAILTGTLHANNEMSFFSPFRFLGPDTVSPASYIGFRARWMRPVDPEQRIWKALGGMRYEVANIVGRISVQFKKEDCLDLPELITEKMSAAIEGVQKQFYDKFKKDLVAKIDDMCSKCVKQNCCDGLCDDEMAVSNIIVMKKKLLQVTSGFYTNTMYDVDDSGVERNVSPIIYFDAQPKINLLREVIAGIPADRKVIIWSCHVPAIKKIVQEFGRWYDPRSIITCYGDQNAFQQSNIFRDDPSKRLMVANQKKMGVGLNMQYSSYMVFYSIDYSYITYDQAIGRQHRQGQKDCVTAFNLSLRKTIDDDVYASVESKGKMDTSLSRFAKVI
jgi:SNF2 family DNA or RNA helicase